MPTEARGAVVRGVVMPVRERGAEIEVRVLGDVVISAHVADIREIAAGGRAEDLGLAAIDLAGRLEEEPRVQNQLRDRDAAVGDAFLAAERLRDTSGRSVQGSTWLCIWLTLPNALRILPTFISRPAGSDGQRQIAFLDLSAFRPDGNEEVGFRVWVDDCLERRFGLVEPQRRRRLDVVLADRRRGSCR